MISITVLSAYIECPRRIAFSALLSGRFLIFCLYLRWAQSLCFFFFNDTATTEIYTLSLHDALPISESSRELHWGDQWHYPLARTAVTCRAYGLRPIDGPFGDFGDAEGYLVAARRASRSEEHTSELQSHLNLVCRLLLEKKKNNAARHANFKQSSGRQVTTRQGASTHHLGCRLTSAAPTKASAWSCPHIV